MLRLLLASHFALLCASANGLGAIIGSRSRAPAVTHHVFFGSSWTDVGNLWSLTSQQQPPRSLYAAGRYSDGPLWPEYLSELQRPDDSLNYAVAGATACPGESLFGSAGTVADQVSRFVSGLLPQQDPGTANRQALSGLMYGAGQNTSPTIWVMIGNNDYLRVVLQALQGRDPVSAVRALPEAVVNCTMRAVSQLVTAASQRTAVLPGSASGSRWRIIVSGMPPMHILPLVTQVTPPSFQSELLQAITRHNTLLQQAVSQLASPSQPTPNAPTIEYYDLFTTVTQIHTDMANEPGIDTTGSCITHRLLYPGMRAMFSAGMAGNTAAASALSGVTRLLGGVSGGVSLSEAFFSSGTRCEDPSRFFWYDEVHPSTEVHERLANILHNATSTRATLQAPTPTTGRTTASYLTQSRP